MPKPVHQDRKPAPKPAINSSRSTYFTCFASCPKGLETLLEIELNQLGASEVKSTSGGCLFKAGWPLAVRITYWSRIAGRVGLRLAHEPCQSETDLYNIVTRIDWPNWFHVEQTLRVDLTNLGADYKNPRFAQLKIKDAVCDCFMRQFNQRPNIDTTQPNIRIFAATTPTHASVYIDLAGENLFKRGWRKDKGIAPLKENLAAGIWTLIQNKLPEHTEQKNYLDPFCGSGTLVIEAVSQLCDRAPGLDRNFAFEHLKPYTPELGQAIQTQANERFNQGLDQVLKHKPLIWKGSDITALMVELAQHNAQQAGLGELLDAGIIQFAQVDALDVKPWAQHGVILSNPPYGERARAKGADIEEDEAYERLFKEYGNLLKQQFTGWTAFLFSGDLNLKYTLGLSPKRKTPLFNGAIECRLFEFPITTGVYRPRAATAENQTKQ